MLEELKNDSYFYILRKREYVNIRNKLKKENIPVEQRSSILKKHIKEFEKKYLENKKIENKEKEIISTISFWKNEFSESFSKDERKKIEEYIIKIENRIYEEQKPLYYIYSIIGISIYLISSKLFSHKEINQFCKLNNSSEIISKLFKKLDISELPIG